MWKHPSCSNNRHVVQAVLPYGLGTWVITAPTITTLEGSHVRLARETSQMLPQRSYEGRWVHPHSAGVIRSSELQKMIIKLRGDRAKWNTGWPQWTYYIYVNIWDIKKIGGRPRKRWWYYMVPLELEENDHNYGMREEINRDRSTKGISVDRSSKG